jgi:hypothetical protein
MLFWLLGIDRISVSDCLLATESYFRAVKFSAVNRSWWGSTLLAVGHLLSINAKGDHHAHPGRSE